MLVDDLGLIPGNRVLLRAPNNPMQAACWFAVLKAGGIVVCTMPLLRARELRYILEHAQINLAITDARFGAALDEALAQPGCPTVPVVRFGNGELESLAQRKPARFGNVLTAADDVAIIAYTSGTTGSRQGHGALSPRHHGGLRLLAAARAASRLPTTCSAVRRPLRSRSGWVRCCSFPCASGASTLLLEQAAPPQLLEAHPDAPPHHHLHLAHCATARCWASSASSTSPA